MIDDRKLCICGHPDDQHLDMCLVRGCSCDFDRNDVNDMLDEIRAGKGEVHD